jgi:limonene-1,2-epoxide hydrolase
MFYDKPAIIGAAAVGAAIKTYMGPTHQLNTTIHESIARGPVVVTVRTDTVTSPGKPDLVFRNVGVFHLKNGKIQEWVDYQAD